MRDVNEALKNLVERLHEAAAENLESILLYGSAARGVFHEAHSDLNVLCTLRSLRVEDLARVAGPVKWWRAVQKQRALLFLTAEELRHAADVFAIELLDMHQSHRVLYGPDVVSGINVPMNLHRIQVEHELRTLLLRLRQHFLLHAESQQELSGVLAKSSSSALTLLRHTLIALLLGSSFVSHRNQMAVKREAVNAAWSQVDVVLQRRADLIPNLVETVKGFAVQEQTVFGEIAKARSALLSANTPADKIAANQRLDSALGRLLVVVENYPQLKSNENFLRLQDELAGTENRIAVERRRYNETVQDYNTYISLFPNNLVASLSGFSRNDAYFKTRSEEHTSELQS